jgi:hypothetical protein
MKNKLHYSFLLCLTIAGSLLLLSWLPKFSLGSLSFRKMDILADVRSQHENDDPVFDTVITSGIEDSIVAKQDSVVQEIQEKCRPGITCIEDYSNDSTALKKFIEALIRTEKTKRNLRIAFYGDSFIEGDVFCGSFRDSLQSVFGGEGVGYVPITSDVAGFRNTVKHKFENWETYSLIKRDSSFAIGPSGYCFVPQDGNWIEFKVSRQRFLRTFNVINLYYRSFKETVLHYTLDTARFSQTLPPSARLKEWKHKGKAIKSATFEFDPHDSLMLYGASFESGEGIYVDNFSLRGNSGMTLASIPDDMYKEFNQYHNYKLIILQFGLNIVVEDSLNYKAYSRRMVNVIESLKENFPESSFLLLSVSDRSSNTSGEFKTMNAIPAMRNAQRQIAQKTGIAFWDMYEAMGGENSMVKFVEAKPPLAAKDYTHLTFKGGRLLSGKLVKSLLFEKEKYEKKKRGV